VDLGLFGACLGILGELTSRTLHVRINRSACQKYGVVFGMASRYHARIEASFSGQKINTHGQMMEDFE
jgi:hypothetical protein